MSVYPNKDKIKQNNPHPRVILHTHSKSHLLFLCSASCPVNPHGEMQKIQFSGVESSLPKPTAPSDQAAPICIQIIFAEIFPLPLPAQTAQTHTAPAHGQGLYILINQADFN